MSSGRSAATFAQPTDGARATATCRTARQGHATCPSCQRGTSMPTRHEHAHARNRLPHAARHIRIRRMRLARDQHGVCSRSARPTPEARPQDRALVRGARSDGRRQAAPEVDVRRPDESRRRREADRGHGPGRAPRARQPDARPADEFRDAAILRTTDVACPRERSASARRGRSERSV